MSRKTNLLLCVFVIASFMLMSAAPAGPAYGRYVDVQILALNDFHGNLEPPSGSSGRIGTTPAGGIEYLATHIHNLEAEQKNTLLISAGDLIGASPLLSALFHDEPTIKAFNMLGMDYSAVGNHEFDEGMNELLRMQYGGCHPEDGCFTPEGFEGAKFSFLTSNVFYDWINKTLFPPYRIYNINGARIGIIGVSLESTPSIVTASGVEGVKFTSEIEAINKAAAQLKKMRVKTIIVVIHNGGSQTGGINDCTNMTGPIVDVVNQSDKEIDAFITGHTHGSYNCQIDGRLVTGAASYGRLITKMNLTVDKATGKLKSIAGTNLIVTRDVAPDPQMTELLSLYRDLAGPIANRVIGTITADITRTANIAGESALGDVIADAQLSSTADPAYGGAVVAFMNPGGIRTDLIYAPSGTELPGEVTYGEAFAVQPFYNNLVTMTLTGAQIQTLLETQFTVNRVLQVSNGFTYTWDYVSKAVSDIAINGVPVESTASYRVTVNIFLADGGDGFAVLKEGTDRKVGVLDIDSFAQYMGANSPVSPGPQNRISVINTP